MKQFKQGEKCRVHFGGEWIDGVYIRYHEQIKQHEIGHYNRGFDEIDDSRIIAWEGIDHRSGFTDSQILHIKEEWQ